MATADINRVGAQVVWAIGARSDLFAFEVEDDRFDKQEIANAIIQTEADLVRMLAESYHPQREPFLQWIPEAYMENGDTVPQHLGQIEAVRVSIDDESESEPEWELAESTTRTNIKLWNAFPLIFGDAGAYYNLTGQTLTFTGDFAQVKAVVYEPLYEELDSESESEDDVTAVLQVDSIWEGLLVNGTIKRLGKLGVPAELIKLHAALWDEAMVRNGLMGKPEVNLSHKLD